MSVSLYRKYRPIRFEDLAGQDHVARTLVNAIDKDRVSHAYLFCGPRGTGKTSAAKILAMALNCAAGDGRPTPAPDGTCPHCEAIRHGTSLDVIEMDAASHNSVDDVRDMREKVNFAPVESRMKVYIIDEVHMLSTAAFNALLKTLEEPPAHTVFVLATTEVHKVPATIVSRCQRFDFRRPSVAEVVGVLGRIATREGIEVGENSLSVIARAANGSFRDAIGILDQLAAYCAGSVSLKETLRILGVVEHDLLFELVDIVEERSPREALLFVERLNQAGTDFTQFLKDLLGHLRDLYVVRHTSEPPASLAATEEQLESLRSQANRTSTAGLLLFIDLVGEALRAIRQGSDPRLELELVLLRVTAPETDSTVLGLAARVERLEREGPLSVDRSLTDFSAARRPAEAGPAGTAGTAGLAGTAEIRAPSTGKAGSEGSMGSISPGAGSRPADTSEQIRTAGPPEPVIEADLDHLTRAWPIIMDAVKIRRAGLFAILSEGRLDSLESGTLVLRFPRGFEFQADQASRDENRRLLVKVLKEVTGRDLQVSIEVAGTPLEQAPADNEGARILSKEELLQILKQEFDAQLIEDAPGGPGSKENP